MFIAPDLQNNQNDNNNEGTCDFRLYTRKYPSQLLTKHVQFQKIIPSYNDI